MSTHFVNLLDGLRRRSLRMASSVEDMLEEACDAALRADQTLAQRVIARDKEIDSEEVEVEAEVIHLITLFQPMASDMRLLCTVLKANSDLERIADCAVNIAERARHLHADNVSEDLKAAGELAAVVRQMLHGAVQAYGVEAEDAARGVLSQEEAADALYGQIIKKVVVAAAGTPQALADYLDLLSIAKNLERIADHATNIAEDVIFLVTGQIVRHQHSEPE